MYAMLNVFTWIEKRRRQLVFGIVSHICSPYLCLTHWGRDKKDENIWISINISLNFVPKGPIDHIPALVQIVAWRRPGDKPLSEPMMISLPTHICVTRTQWVNHLDEDYESCLLPWKTSQIAPIIFMKWAPRFSFHLKSIDSPPCPLPEVYPDTQFYSRVQYTQCTKCDYYLEDKRAKHCHVLY